jgi:hypothetical protein
MDIDGKVFEFLDEIKIRNSQNNQNNNNGESGAICHDCRKDDLRMKVQLELAYTQYKEAIKVNNEGYEYYVVIFIICGAISMFWISLR